MEIDSLRRPTPDEASYVNPSKEGQIYDISNIISGSKVLSNILRIAEKVATADSTVLITGETGVGKGLVAGVIHRNSLRRENNFVQVNCAAVPDSLLESELFGHEKGAFTGAVKMHIGRIEQAHMGTIFLDEIGDMDVALQAKILRVLEELEFERVGGSHTIKADVRVIAATNRDLLSLVREGKFREDLYYRINVVNIDIPPIREHKEDIEPLVRFFVSRYAAKFNKEVKDIAPLALQRLIDYDWPGNVREIRNCIERAILLAEGDTLQFDDISINRAAGQIPLSNQQCGAAPGQQSDNLSSLNLSEKELLLIALRTHDWVQKDAAKALGISKRVMNYKIEKHGITHHRWIKNR